MSLLDGFITVFLEAQNEKRVQSQHCIAIFSRFVFLRKTHSKNGSSSTIFDQKISTWSHSKEKIKLYNRTLAFFEFRFHHWNIEFSSISKKVKKRISEVFFKLRDLENEIQKKLKWKCRKNISLSFDAIFNSISWKLWD